MGGYNILDKKVNAETDNPNFRGESVRIENSKIDEFPKHLYAPSDARTFDMARLVIVPANTITPVVLMEYTVRESFVMQITHYAIVSDALLLAEAWFLPTINGSRILPFHGDPMDNMKISLGRTADLGNAALIPCNIQLRTGDVIKWEVVNTANVDTTMGVRQVGWIDNSVKRTSKNFGG
jgi:hypothetical protein